MPWTRARRLTSLESERDEAKFLDNATPVIGDDRARRVRGLVRGLERVADMRELIRLCA